ncbi:aspartyl-tRNA synthetase 2 [Mactra antiquata]
MSFLALRRLFSQVKRHHLEFLAPSNQHGCKYRMISDAVSFTQRSHTCGSLCKDNVGQKVKLCGWLQYNRGTQFSVLRDWTGITQIFTTSKQKEFQDLMKSIKHESVLCVVGKVKSRPDKDINPNMATGEIEVEVEEIEVLSQAEPLPFPVSEFYKISERIRMEYRYLDIRSKQMQRNLRIRSKMIMKMREFLANKHEFVDVETPTLFRRTPGGAKEFVVPTQHHGKFYSLPQSPQQFKQLLMVGGIDRYFQIARCYRDEGAKPDRQPEFTQLDIEMSFVEREGVIQLIEEMLQYSWPEDCTQIVTPFPHITYEQAMRLYGTDKPDTRFNMKIQDITSSCKDCGVTLIDDKLQKDNGNVVAIKVSDTQRILSKKCVEDLKTDALKALGDIKTVVIPIRVLDDGSWQSPISKHLSDHVRINISNDLDLQPGDLVLIAAGQNYSTYEVLGKLRLFIADYLESKDIQVREKDVFNFLWVTDFPLFLPKEGGEGLESAHHPFTDVHPDDRHFLDTHPEKVRGLHYDLVLNGSEVGGGSIRIHHSHLQKYILEQILKVDISELEHLLKAFTLGCPPHGGIALGLDRLFAMICGTPSIRDVIAFPKSHDGKDPMSKAPATVSQCELDTYHIQVKPQQSS